MRKWYHLWISGALLLACLTGCETAQPSAPDTSAPTSVAASTEPALPPKPTVEMATQPAATSMPTAAPTVPPTVPPTAAPTEVPTSTALLPADDIWVQSAHVVLPLADSSAPLDFAQRGYPAPVYWPRAAPNGAYIVYGTEQGGLALVDVRAGASRTLVEDGTGVAGYSFSPDARQLAITTITDTNWTLHVRDLENNGAQVLRSGSTVLTDTAPLPLVPGPVAWTANGIVVRNLLYASDAPPRDLTVINPSHPSNTNDRQIYEGAFIDAYVSPDGSRFAVVTGTRPMGGGVPTTQIKVVDQQGKEFATIRDEQPGLLRALAWSPDGTMLLYALAPDYETPNVTLHLVHADASNAQELDLVAQGISASFRDIAWRDNATVLLLTEGEQLQLDAVPVDNFSATARQPLRTFQDQHPGNGNARILYVPR
ncbi:MAG TPA: hypothetical protein VFT66_09505 [Roseiflexaceae bacterium]|nr:hypothetical protein [Roseiflexaceae bacterium]